MTLHISSREAASKFSDLVKQIQETGDAFIVEEGGQEVCAITPIDGGRRRTLAEFAEFFRKSPRVDEQYLAAVEEHVNRINHPKAPESRWDC